MQCTQCGWENRQGRRFCGRCGGLLSLTCPDCRFVNEPDERFCGGCGRALVPATPEAPPAVAPAAEEARRETDTAPPGPDAERRQITVMFCDLAGSTTLAERLDPEDLRDLMSLYQHACRRAVEQFEGFIARYVGDGLLVYFGYPRAHEDDPERALRAGLGITRAVSELRAPGGLALQVRVGIATGVVVAGEVIGEGASAERAVVGETPNLATRLQGAAAPGSVVISDSTRRLAGPMFEYEALGSLRLKGISSAVEAWRVLGEREAVTRFEAAVERGLTPLVGREEEIGLLAKRWEQAKEGEGQVVLLAGEAGVGKSRVLRGLREMIDAELREPIFYLCSVHHQNTALYPAVEHLKRFLGFERSDDSARRLDKLDAALDRLGLPARELAPVLAALLALPAETRYPPVALPPGETKRKTLEALARLVEALAARHPLLMVVEDVHWIDASTRELLELIIERALRSRLLLLLTYRTEYEARWPHHGHATLMTLNRLSRRQTRAMVAGVTAGKALPEAVLDQIVAKTDGVPLFVEELTKTLLESDLFEEREDHYVLRGALPSFAVPASLHDSLMARLDRLAAVKEIAQVGATIGRTFSHELLAAVCARPEGELERATSALVEAGLLYRYGLPPEVSYEFKHALVQDAAYTSLLRSRRQQYHQCIARALEERFTSVAETEPALLAHHYTQAGLPQQAIGYWLRAGELLHDQGSVDMSMSAYRKALEIAEEGEPRCRALIGLAGGMRVTDDYDNALQALDEAQRLAAHAELTRELARIHHLRGNLYFPLGNVAGCLKEHEHALRYAQEAADTENEARALSGLGDAHYSRGRMRTSLGYFRRCIELSRRDGYLHIAVGNQYMVAWTRFYMNEIREALTDALDAIDAAVDIGYLRAEMVARLTASRVLCELAEFEAATEHVERGLIIAEMLGANRFKPFLMIFRAQAELADGERGRTQALRLLEEAMTISRQTSVGFLGPWVLSMQARASTDAARVRRALAEGEAILQNDCVGHNYFAFYRNAMEAALELRDWDEAERYAGALEAFCQPEPLPRCEFYIARARALTRLGRNGPSDREAVATLQRLRAQGEQVGLRSALPAIEAALGE